MNARRPRRSSAAETAAFDRVCDRLGGFDAGLDFEWIDGFLAALAASPRLPAAAEWLTAMCGDNFDRCFADPEDRAQALAALEARLQVLCDQLDPAELDADRDALRLDPFIGETGADERRHTIEAGSLSPEEAALLDIGAAWADGFLHATAAFSALWAPPAAVAAGPLLARAFAHIAALRLAPESAAFGEHVRTEYRGRVPDRERLLVEACLAVQDLRMVWIDFAPRTAPRRAAPAPGRNDPCPCGSGRKFKKCHGLPPPQ